MPNIPYDTTQCTARKLNLEEEEEKERSHLHDSIWSSRSVASKIVELFSVVVEKKKGLHSI